MADDAPHIQRMKEELAGLEERIEKLDEFIDANPIYKSLPEVKRALMYSQLKTMETYACVLETRLRIETGDCANG